MQKFLKVLSELDPGKTINVNFWNTYQGVFKETSQRSWPYVLWIRNDHLYKTYVSPSKNGDEKEEKKSYAKDYYKVFFITRKYNKYN